MLTRTCFVVALVACPAFADLVVNNTTPEQYRVEVTEPNGKVSTRKLNPSNPSASSQKFIFGMGVKTVSLAVFDDSDASVFKGSVSVDDVLVLISEPKGVRMLNAGTYGGTAGPRASVFVNATGEKLTFDLVGMNGLASSRGITPGTSFDLKKPVKLDARESIWTVEGKSASGEDLKALNIHVGASRYYVFYRSTTTSPIQVLAGGTLTAR